MNRREFVKLSSFAAVGLGSKKLPAFASRNIPPPIITTNLVGQWNFIEGWNQIVFNRTGPVTYPSFTNLYGTGAEQFAQNATYNEGWSIQGGASLTDFVGTDPNGNSGATRLLFTAGSGKGISNTKTLTAVNYTISFYVKSNTGFAQNIRLIGNTTSTDLAVTTSWTQVSYTFTGLAGATITGITGDAANDAVDILIYGAILQIGSSASTYTPAIFDLQLGSLSIVDSNDPTWQTYGIDLGQSKYTYGVTTVAPTMTHGSVYVAMKKTGADASGGLEPIITDDTNGPFWINTIDTFSDPAQGNERPNFIFSGSAVYANSINLTDHAWHIFTGTYDGTTIRFYLDGTQIAQKTASLSARVLHRLYFGEAPSISSSQYYFPGSVGMAAVYTDAHSAATVQSTVATIQGDMACRGIAVGPQSQFVLVEGDSISDPNNIATGLTILQGWSYLMFHTISPIVQGSNFAVSGSTLTTMTARATAVDASYNPNTATTVLTILIGRNDFVTGITPANFVAAYKTYCLNRKTANPGLKIIVVPVLPSTLANFNTWRNTANALIAADPDFSNGTAADLIATTDPTMWADAAASSLTLYSDGTHPTATGMTYIEAVEQTAITSFF